MCSRPRTITLDGKRCDRKLWAHDTFVGFRSWSELRRPALAGLPFRFCGKRGWIETIPRRGYRLVGQWNGWTEVAWPRLSSNHQREPGIRSANCSLALRDSRGTHWSRNSHGIPLIGVALLAAMVAARLAFPPFESRKSFVSEADQYPASKRLPLSAGSLVSPEEDSVLPDS